MGRAVTVRTARICAECGRDYSGISTSTTCSPVCAFWGMVDRSGGPDACWPWTGHVTPTTGYGDVSDRIADGKRASAHRHAWKLHNVCDPDKLCVLHRCDNRICANPAHLFLGSHRVNTRDAWSKGRGVVCVRLGEDHHNAKLTDAIVREIRASSEINRVLASRYGVSIDTIRSARRGTTWRHLPPA